MSAKKFCKYCKSYIGKKVFFSPEQCSTSESRLGMQSQDRLFCYFKKSMNLFIIMCVNEVVETRNLSAVLLGNISSFAFLGGGGIEFNVTIFLMHQCLRGIAGRETIATLHTLPFLILNGSDAALLWFMLVGWLMELPPCLLLLPLHQGDPYCSKHRPLSL